MSNHGISTAAPKSIGELSGNILSKIEASRDHAVASAMRSLESRMHDLANMTDIMSDLVFDAFSGTREASEGESARALFSVNDVHRRVCEMKDAYLAAYDAGRPATSREARNGGAASAMQMIESLDLSGVEDAMWIGIYDGLTLAAHGIEGIMQRPQCQERDELNAAGLYLQAISDFLLNERRRAMEMLIHRPFNPTKDPHLESMVALQWLASDSNGEELDELESFVTTARERHKAHEEYRAGKVVLA